MLYRFSVALIYIYIVYSTVSTLYYLTMISNMCYILQILFVSEMVNNFYQFVFVLFNCEELANDYLTKND